MATNFMEEPDDPRVLSDDDAEPPPSAKPYAPPVQFKIIDKPPLIQGHASDSTELWLIRIQDSQLGPEDFKEKQVTMSLKPLEGKLGTLQNSKGIQFDILDLHHNEGVQPFAFFPKDNAGSLDALRISRQVAFARSLDPNILLSNCGTHNDEQLEQEDAALKRKSSSKKHQHSSLHMLSDVAALDELAKMLPEENQARSASTGMTMGGISCIDSLRQDEERISTAQFSKSAKKLKAKEQQKKEFNLSPQRHSNEVVKLQETDLGTSADKKSRKHKRAKMEKPIVS